MGQISGSPILDRPALVSAGRTDREWTLYRSQILSEMFDFSVEGPKPFVKPFFDLVRRQIHLVAVRMGARGAQLRTHDEALAANCSHTAST